MYRCNPVDYAKQIKANLDLGPDKFFGWFDGGNTVIEAYEKSADIFNRIILPMATKYLGDLKDKISLDMGYGSGGQVVAASKHFKESMGTDWHEEEEFVAQNASEFYSDGDMLFGSSPDKIPVDADDADFLHSWLFVQRLGTTANVQHYLSECFRVLKPGGVGVIFFPRYIRSGKNQTVGEYEADVRLEMEDKMGYREGGESTILRGISIVVARWRMQEWVEEAGFKVLTWTASYDGKGRGKVYHGQHGIVFQKPAPKKVAAPKTPPKKATPAPKKETPAPKKSQLKGR